VALFLCRGKGYEWEQVPSHRMPWNYGQKSDKIMIRQVRPMVDIQAQSRVS